MLSTICSSSLHEVITGIIATKSNNIDNLIVFMFVLFVFVLYFRKDCTKV